MISLKLVFPLTQKYLGQYFLHRAIGDCRPSLFVSPSLAVTVSGVSCRPCLQFSLFVKLFHIKITFNKETVFLRAPR